MIWNLVLIGMFVIAAVISGMALMSGSGHPHRRR
jgi:hypothetical protein